MEKILLLAIIIIIVLIGYNYDKPSEKKCSYYENSPIQYVPVKCLKEFGITTIK